MAGQPIVHLPDPCLVVLIGAAGSGKSTLAARHFALDEVLSSDGFRERIAGDATDQRATGPAFAALHRSLRRRLAAARTTVVDATNVTARARLALLGEAARAGVPAVALVLDLPADRVLAANRRRGTSGGRAVPEAAVLGQLVDLRRGADPARLAREGFAIVVWLTEPADLDALRIARGPVGGPPR